jgi:hypothetical protein
VYFLCNKTVKFRYTAGRRRALRRLSAMRG